MSTFSQKTFVCTFSPHILCYNQFMYESKKGLRMIFMHTHSLYIQPLMLRAVSHFGPSYDACECYQ